MSKQLLFCLETNKKAATDEIYINETMTHFYNVPNTEKISIVYMGSKNKYNDKSVLTQIKDRSKNYTLGNTYVIYCIDVDAYESNPNHIREFDEIALFCKQNGYELIWFCHDVEDVFLKKQIPSSEKVGVAAGFRRRNGIADVSIAALTSSNNHSVHTSNIMSVLDRYLNRKER